MLDVSTLSTTGKKEQCLSYFICKTLIRMPFIEPLSIITNENVDADCTRMPFIEVE